jgi:glycosyltransferase involved in cell wall biosynthesis
MGCIQNPYNKKYKAFCLAWELYPEMKIQLNSHEWDNKIKITQESAMSSTEILVATDFAIPFYNNYGIVRKMQLGLNTDLFKPLLNKNYLRIKYNLPLNAKIGYWGGTNHRMKGFDKLIEYANNNSDIYWVIVWKQESEVGNCPSYIKNKQYIKIPQIQINELMNCCDFFLCTSLLRPYYMTELEAMATNIEFVFTEKIEKDFNPSNNPRNDIFINGWDRLFIKNKWIELFNEYKIEY